MLQANEYAPVVIFTYNREDYTKRILESINSSRGAEFTDLYIFSDAAPSEKQAHSVETVRKNIDDFIRKKSNFRSVTVTKAEKNKGLATSIIDGVSEIIKQYGKVIVLEDDLIVAPDFLEYMNDGLKYYENNQKIWAMSGYSFQMESLDSYPNDIYLAMRGCSWGWATWLDRWETVDWEVKDYHSIKYNWHNRLEFGRWGREMPVMLDANVYGYNHSWAIRWCYSAYKQQKYTVYPKVSRVLNAGTDGSGTNFKKKTHKFDTRLSDGKVSVKFVELEPNKEIEREFRWKSKKKLGFIRDFFKWTFIKIVKR